MIMIGVDTHKRSHTVVALDATTDVGGGITRGQLTVVGMSSTVAHYSSTPRVYGVVDCSATDHRVGVAAEVPDREPCEALVSDEAR
jgi:hypothetical protein